MNMLNLNSLSPEIKTKLGIVEFSCTQSRLTLSLYGGQILSFFNVTKSQEYLYLSPHTAVDGISPIRGGIPICWPWFATQNPRGITGRHGWLRTHYWQLNSVKQQEHSIAIRLQPEPLNHPLVKELAVWLDIQCGDDLSLTLNTENHGESEVQLTQALHSYLRVANLTSTAATGLPNTHYCQVKGLCEQSSPLELVSALRNTEEIDRIYYPEGADCQRSIKISPDNVNVDCEGGDSIVVWNPGKNKAEHMADIKQSFDHFICIEAAQTKPIVLAPKQQIRLTQTIG